MPDAAARALQVRRRRLAGMPTEGCVASLPSRPTKVSPPGGVLLGNLACGRTKSACAHQLQHPDGAETPQVRTRDADGHPADVRSATRDRSEDDIATIFKRAGVHRGRRADLIPLGL